MQGRIREIYTLEQLSRGSTCIHVIHPGAKLFSVLVFIVAVVSFGRYEIGRLIPYLFFPVILMALSETPWTPVLKRVLLALPFVLLACVSNLILDRGTASIADFAVSLGALSCFSILFRTFLCVVAVLLLIAVTPFGQLTSALRQWHIPNIFVTLFELTYRYIIVLLDEAGSMYTAYILRAPDNKGLQMKHMGSFAGQLLLRSFDRAERIFAAMKCRGYDRHAALRQKRPLLTRDAVYLCCTVLPCILLRVFDATRLFDIAGGLF